MQTARTGEWGEPSAPETMISVQGVSKTFEVQAVAGKRGRTRFGRSRGVEKRVAVRDVSFDVPRGSTVGIIGPNGAGKSTLLKLVTGILEPDSGSVEIRGSVTPILGLGAGFAPQLSGIENIYLKGAALGMSDREVDAHLDEIREFSGIGYALNRPFRTYSSGMRMRLAFSLAFLKVPEVLVVDETIAVGDEVFHRKSMSRIEEIKDAGATILLVSHGAHVMRGFCDRILLLDEGEILIDALPEPALEAYQRLVYAAPGDRTLVRRQIREKGHGRLPEQRRPRAPAAAERSSPAGPRRAADTRPLGGQITGCRFLSPDGAETRQVESGGSLRAELHATFGMPARDVSIKVGISTSEGFELGAVHLAPEGTDDPFVTAGQRATFSGELRFPLAAGTYHVGAELMGYVGGELQCLHRRSGLKVLEVTGEDPSVEGPVLLAGGE